MGRTIFVFFTIVSVMLFATQYPFIGDAGGCTNFDGGV